MNDEMKIKPEAKEKFEFVKRYRERCEKIEGFAKKFTERRKEEKDVAKLETLSLEIISELGAVDPCKE